MTNKDGGGDNFKILWGGHSCYEGGHRAHGGIPPLGKTLNISYYDYFCENLTKYNYRGNCRKLSKNLSNTKL